MSLKAKLLASIRAINARIQRIPALPIITVTLSGIAISFLVARNVFGLNLVFGDNPLVTQNSASVIGDYLFKAWHLTAYGENLPTSTGYLLLYAFSSTASALGHMELYTWLLNLSIPLSFFSSYVLIRKFCKSTVARIAGSAFYVINPVVISAYVAGVFMWSFVFLPLSLAALLELLERQNFRNVAKVAATSGLVIWAFPTITVALGILFAFVLLGQVATKRLRVTRKLALWIGLTGVLVVILNMAYYFLVNNYSNSPQFGYQSSSVLADFTYTYQDASVLNLLRLAGNIGSPQAPLGYNDLTNVANLIGYIIPMIAIAGFLLVKETDERKRFDPMFYAFIGIACFAALLDFLATSQASWVIQNLSFLWTLRNPLRLQVVLLLAVAPVFAFSLEKLGSLSKHYFQGKEYRKFLVTFFIVLLGISQIYSYNAFAFNGYMGMDVYSGNKIATLGPDGNIAGILDNPAGMPNQAVYRGIILPFDHSAELNVEFANPLIYPARLGLVGNVTSELADSLDAPASLGNLLSLLSTRYVFLNNGWKDTTFSILQPDNLSLVASDLGGRPSATLSNGNVSEFIVSTALPRVYLSDYAVLSSNPETIGLVNSSVFSHYPVLLPVTQSGCGADGSGGSPVLCSYNWQETPQQGTYGLYVVAYGNNQSVPIYYSLDNGPLSEATLSETNGTMGYVGGMTLNTGPHDLGLGTGQLVSLSSLNTTFVGKGTWSVSNGSVTVENGVLRTSKAYGSFDLNVDFTPESYGAENWQGPNIYFAQNASSYVRLIFHSDGYLEIATKSAGTYHAGVFVKTVSTLPSKNHLRLIKHGETLGIYLNGNYVTQFQNPVMNNVGSIGLGSDNSTTYYSSATVDPNVIAGVWMFPQGMTQAVSQPSIAMGPASYQLNFHQANASNMVIFLGETYDPMWVATMDGTALTTHMMTNTYGNGWVAYASPGDHTVDLSYAPNRTYQILLFISVSAMAVLLLIAYVPRTLLRDRDQESPANQKSEILQEGADTSHKTPHR